jgi:hypothetical protein
MPDEAQDHPILDVVFDRVRPVDDSASESKLVPNSTLIETPPGAGR